MVGLPSPMRRKMRSTRGIQHSAAEIASLTVIVLTFSPP